MRCLVLLVADVAFMFLPPLFALFLREDCEVAPNRFAGFLPYLAATVGTALAIFSAAGLNRSLWGFSGLHDHLMVTGAVAAILAGSAGFAFAYNRLDGVARSLPFLQFLSGTAFLTGASVVHRLAYGVFRDSKNARRTRRRSMSGTCATLWTQRSCLEQCRLCSSVNAYQCAISNTPGTS